MASSSDSNVIDFTTALGSLSTTVITNDQDFKKIIQSFLDSNRDKLADWVNNTVTFAGFDAVSMRKKISSKATPRAILIAVIIGLVRGNNIDRISKTMKSTEVQKEFNDIVRDLKIKKNVGGDYSAVTLSRMVACYPKVVSYMLHHADIQMAVPFSEMTIIHADYPKVARHQVCASILPHSLSAEEINKALDVILVPYLKVSEVINSKVKDWNKMTSSSKAETSSLYLHNSYNSKVLTLEEREAMSTKYSIMNSQKKLTAAWVSTAEKATAWLKARYGFTHTEL